MKPHSPNIMLTFYKNLEIFQNKSILNQQVFNFFVET